MRPLLTTTALAGLALAALNTGAAGAEDRYGPPPPANPARDDAVPAGTAFLSWPGKTAPTAPTPAPAPPPPPPAAYPPTNIYAPPPPAQAGQPSPATASSQADQHPAGAGGEPPRFYSVHRAYGLQPDPIALSPQFVAESGGEDLAEPPPPPPHYTSAQTANMGASAAANQARAAARAQEAAQTADPGSAN